MYSCDRCGKGAQVGMNVSHSHRRTKKRSMPNIHKVTLTIGGRRESLSLCTKCLRVVKKTAVLKPREKVEEVREVKEPQVITKVEKTGTLSEAIEKSTDKKESVEASKG